MAKSKRTEKDRKIFVLDTSVIIFTHNSIMNFDEHDVAIPITVLEEIDQFKKGNDTKNFEAREFSRLLDKLSKNHVLQQWNPLNGSTKGKFKVLMSTDSSIDATDIFGEDKPDHRILNATLKLTEEFPERKIILVSKDINLRLKAKSLGITAEDYTTGKVKDVNTLYTGKYELKKVDPELINELYERNFVEAEKFPERKDFKNNAYFILKHGKKSALAYYNALEDRVELVERRTVSGIKPRNAEQAFAIHALMNPHVKLVSLQGVAGTGKTLLALAASLEQKKEFRQIFLARPIVPLSNKDIGFLPGDIKSKLNPYMEPLWDNLKFIQSQYKESDKEYKKITDMIETEKLLITPLAYIRGRSLSNIIFIVDEAQNLTPHEVKTIITRAGDNTKVVFTGDVYQIDTPYLDSQSNGLSFLIDKVKGHELYSHVTLEKGERSELANLANDML